MKTNNWIEKWAKELYLVIFNNAFGIPNPPLKSKDTAFAIT